MVKYARHKDEDQMKCLLSINLQVIADALPSSQIMGLNLILVVIVIITSCITILQTFRDPVTNSRRWIHVSFGLLACTLLGLLFWHNVAGYVSIAAWCIFAVLPSFGFRFSDRLFYQGNFEGARRVKSYLRWLHPLEDWPWQDALYRAYELARQDKHQEANCVIEQAQNQPPTVEQICTILYFRQDWSGLIEWWESYPDRGAIEARPDFARHYLRALGERGELNKLLQVICEHYSTFQKVPLLQEHCYLYAFTFGGQVEHANKLLHAPVLENIGPDMRTIWIATAHCAAGNHEMANALLRPILRTTKDGMVRNFAENRLHCTFCSKLETITAENKKFLQKLEREWLERQRMVSIWH